MKRVLLVLSLCLVGGLASPANADECHRGGCRDAYRATADESNCHGSSYCDHGRRGPICRVIGARPIRKLLENRPVRRFLFGRYCG